VKFACIAKGTFAWTAVFLTALLFVRAAAAAEPIPVQWDKVYIATWFPDNTPIPQDPERLWTLPLGDLFTRYPIVVAEEGKEREVTLMNCADAVEYLPHFVRQVDPVVPGRYLLLTTGVDCNSISRLARLRPAQTTYLPLGTRKVLRKLGYTVLPSKNRRDVTFFRDLRHIKRVMCMTRDEQDWCNVGAGRNVYDTWAIAAGDYNGDGIGDLIIKFDYYPSNIDDRYGRQGNYTGMIGAVITQTSKDGTPIVLDWWGPGISGMPH
jgi:FG-GAP repeat